MDIGTFLQNESQHPTDYRCGFVAIVGRPNVGKSTLMNHLIGQKISITSKKAQTTRNRVTGIYTDDTAQFVFVDTPGFQTNHRNALNDRLNQNVTEALSGVDVVVFVVEAMRFTDADRVVLKQLPKHTPVVLVVNKIDKEKPKTNLRLRLLSMKYAKSLNLLPARQSARNMACVLPICWNCSSRICRKVSRCIRKIW